MGRHVLRGCTVSYGETRQCVKTAPLFFATQTTHLLLLHCQLLLLQERQQLLCVNLLCHPDSLLLQLRHLCNSMVQASSLARRQQPAAVNGNSKAQHITARSVFVRWCAWSCFSQGSVMPAQAWQGVLHWLHV